MGSLKLCEVSEDGAIPRDEVRRGGAKAYQFWTKRAERTDAGEMRGLGEGMFGEEEA